MEPASNSKLLPISFTSWAIVKIVDYSEKIKKFIEVTNQLTEEAPCRAFITNKKPETIYYKSKKHYA